MDTAGTVRADAPGTQPGGSLLRLRMAVRRLTPRECERLQGMPDDYTLIPYRGKPAADGPRYRAIGNSMAVTGDAVDRAAHSDGGQHLWLKPASRPRWRGTSRSGPPTGWCPTPKTRGLTLRSRLAQIAASIVEFGFVNPILVDSMDGIIAGHGRLLAARKLGLAEVPVVVLGHLSEIQRRAYVIADNQLALNAGWNDELLRGVLESLGADGFDLSLVGFLRRGTRHACLAAPNRRPPPLSRKKRFPNLPRSRLRCPGMCG